MYLYIIYGSVNTNNAPWVKVANEVPYEAFGNYL